MKYNLFKILMIIILSMFFLPNAYAESIQKSKQNPSVVVLIIDYLNVEELKKHYNILPGFKRVTSEGAIGLLNNRTAGKICSENTYVTIGAGTRAVGSKYASQAFKIDESVNAGLAYDIYYQISGKNPPENSVVNLGIFALIKRNSVLPHNAEIGGLGEVIRRSGYKTAVFGNADLAGNPDRLVVCIAMDKHGIVDYGIVGKEILTYDPMFPGGKRTNYQALLGNIKDSLREYQLIVVEMGNTRRLNKQRLVLDNNFFQQNYKKVLKMTDDFLAKLIEILSEEDLLLIMSPTPSEAMIYNNKRLTSVIMWNKNDNNSDVIIGKRVLTSATIKCKGIVMSIDIAPTILKHLEIEQPSFIKGRPMYSTLTHVDNITYLQQNQDYFAAVYSARSLMQTSYVLMQILILKEV
ncbi:hypothetical protein M1N12_02755 [Peptococcaceae bacterium]|nr:hypothetical protein [Peptococcaceae bacterium]MCL0106416.1 hypothetical protein [Peptococcaceae bacterium]